MYNVFSLLHRSSQLHPQKVYIIDKDIEWCYDHIYQKVLALAEYIKHMGTTPGDRIIICLDNSVEYITALFASMLVNGIVVPINKNMALDNIKYIMKDTSAELIILSELFLRRNHDKIDFSTCKVINIDNVFNNLHLSCSESLINQLSEDSSLPAMILYTSGTSSLPKGVTLTHKNLLVNTASILQYLKLAQEDSILATINFSYSYGNSILLTHTGVGGKIVIENRVAYPIKIIEQLFSSKVTGFSTVGSYINILLKQDGLKDFHFKYLKYITFAGENTNFEDIFKLNSLAPHISIFVMYGQTEASARLSYLEPSLLFKKPGTIGKGIPGVTLRVVTEDGEDVKVGEVGEIIAFGDNVMKGYWNNEAETKLAIKDGWLYTNDMAIMDEDGYIYVKGRKDDIIKYMGHRISPVEIESVINSYGFVLESAVIGVESSEEKQIKAYIVPSNNAFEIEDIKSHIKRFLPAFKRPHILEIVEELPRTPNGKIKRSELRSRSS